MNTLWPIGLSTGCFYHHGICTVLEEIRASGFEPIEVCSYPEHLDYHHENDVRRYRFHGGLIIEMSARENETVADTLTRARRGRDFLAHLLPSRSNDLHIS